MSHSPISLRDIGEKMLKLARALSNMFVAQ